MKLRGAITRKYFKFSNKMMDDKNFRQMSTNVMSILSISRLVWRFVQIFGRIRQQFTTNNIRKYHFTWNLSIYCSFYTFLWNICYAIHTQRFGCSVLPRNFGLLTFGTFQNAVTSCYIYYVTCKNKTLYFIKSNLMKLTFYYLLAINSLNRTYYI